MIYTIGESVLDIIISDFDHVKMRPGGSMLNSAISAARLGCEVSHVSCLSSDVSSQKLIDFLQINHVNCDFVLRESKFTNLALAYLNKNSDAEYIFYKNENKNEIDLLFPNTTDSDIILFGSFFSLNQSYRRSLIQFLLNAKKNGATVVYDPNFRKAHLKDIAKYKVLIEENIRIADIVKASDEDFVNIFSIKGAEQSFNHLKNYGTKALIYTKGSEGAECFVTDKHVYSSGVPVKALSTIGAGDTFSAGVVYHLNSLIKEGYSYMDIHEDKWIEILDFCNHIASSVCGSYDNYIKKK